MRAGACAWRWAVLVMEARRWTDVQVVEPVVDGIHPRRALVHCPGQKLLSALRTHANPHTNTFTMGNAKGA